MRPAAVEVGLGSEQWGRKERIELCWQRESVARAKERILERLREKQDRRTPVPVTVLTSLGVTALCN